MTTRRTTAQQLRRSPPVYASVELRRCGCPQSDSSGTLSVLIVGYQVYTSRSDVHARVYDAAQMRQVRRASGVHAVAHHAVLEDSCTLRCAWECMRMQVHRAFLRNLRSCNSVRLCRSCCVVQERFVWSFCVRSCHIRSCCAWSCHAWSCRVW